MTARCGVHSLYAHCYGLTLIELLVALAVIGLLALLLFSGLRFGERVWDRGVAARDRLDELVTAQEFLRGRLQLIDPFGPAADPARRVAAVLGGEDSLEFTAPLPQAASSQGLVRYRLSVKQDSGRRTLYVDWRRDRSGEPASAQDTWVSEPLVTGIGELTFRYLERGADHAPRWLTQWRGRRDVPALVSLMIRFTPADGRHWPALIVRPRLTASADCAFDAVSRRCRS